MNFDLDEDQLSLAGAVRDFLTGCGDRVGPAAARAVLDGADDDRLGPGRAGWAASGFATIPVPESAGGGGGQLLDLAVVAEQAGRQLAGPSLVSYARAAVLLAEDPQRLADLCSGELALAVVDEPAAVLDAIGADTFLVRRGEQVFACPATVQRRTPMDPTRGLAAVQLHEGVPVPVAPHAWQRAWHVGRVVLAAEGLGAADRAVQLGVDYAKQRMAFGRPIGSYQAVKHALVEAYVRVEQLRSLVWWAAWAADQDPQALPLAAAAAKGAAAVALQQATDTLVQVHGGIGFTWEHDAHLYWRRGRVDRLLLGSDEEAFDEVATLALATDADADAGSSAATPVDELLAVGAGGGGR